MNSFKRALFVKVNWKSNGTLSSVKTPTTLLSILTKLGITYTAICIEPIYIRKPYAYSLAKAHSLTNAQNFRSNNESAYTEKLLQSNLKTLESIGL